MLDAVHIENFGCIREISLRLCPLTALVGPNGCGKSTILRALAPNFQVTDGVAYCHRSDAEIRVTVTAGAQSGTRGRERALETGKLRDVSGGLYARGWTYDLLRLDLDRLRLPVELASEQRLSTSASNLANVLATMPRRRRETVFARFCELVPMFADVDLRPSGSGRHQPWFQDRWNERVWYDASEVSDGSLFMLALLTLEHQEAPPQIVAIEEIERGLHPYLLGQVVQHLRAWAERPGGPMIVLATHSAEVLDRLRPEEVRFLSRDPASGDVVVEQAPDPSARWDEVMRRYRNSLGAIWLAGGLGGVPA